MKQLKAMKIFGSLLASFTSVLHPSNMTVFRLKDRKVKTWSSRKGIQETFIVPFLSANPSIASEREYFPF
jgi:hypothetical protein